MRVSVRRRAALAVALSAFAMRRTLAAEDYPARPIRFVVPYGAGGYGDTLARLIGQRMSEALRQPLIIENRPGAGTIIGTEAAAKSEPDGYTLLLISTTHTVNPSLVRNLPYDLERDFAPVALVADSPFVLVVSPDVPARTVRELIALAQERPGDINYASTGQGSSHHLTAELFCAEAGIRMEHVPYRGTAPAIADILAGRVQVLFTSTVTALPFVRDGRLRALGVTSRARIAAAPDLPTVAEAGLPDYEASSWLGMLVPARTPQPIVERLHSEVRRALMQPEVVASLRQEGANAPPLSPAEFGAFIRRETDKWARLIHDRGITAG